MEPLLTPDSVKTSLLQLASADFPQFLAMLDLGSCRDPQMSSNLLTVALLQFLHATEPLPLSGGFGLARVKAASENGTYATLFIRKMGSFSNCAFTAMGVPEDGPDEQVFDEMLIPSSLSMEDHEQRLQADPRLPAALALIETSVLRMLATPQQETSAHLPRHRL